MVRAVVAGDCAAVTCQPNYELGDRLVAIECDPYASGYRKPETAANGRLFFATNFVFWPPGACRAATGIDESSDPKPPSVVADRFAFLWNSSPREDLVRNAPQE